MNDADAHIEAKTFPYTRPRAQERSTMEATAPITAESVVDGSEAPLDVERPGKARYARIRANGRTLAYADDRKDGFRMNITLADTRELPQRFASAVDGRSMLVTARNAKTATALLEWLAKQAQNGS